MKILLTGTRAPATLDLARRLWREGHTMVGADSMRFPLGRFSRAFDSHYEVPPPRQRPMEFAEAMLRLVDQHQIDLLWPTCEEIFHLAAIHARLCQRTKVLCMPLDTLELLHHKLEFARLVAAKYPTAQSPPSWAADEAPTNQRLVWKPCYSRFAVRTRFDAPPASKDGWMAQAFIPGREFSSWSLCIAGEIRLQTFYQSPARAGRGAGCAFDPLWPEDAADFIKEIAQDLAFTGSLAFDFIRTDQGALFVLECNPRLTSGIHVLNTEARVSDRLERPLPQCGSQRSAQLRLPVIFTRPRLAGTSPDVISDHDDPWPTWGQAATAAEFAWRAMRRRVSLLAATTWDIEYNGV